MQIRELFKGADIEAIHGITLNTWVSGIASDSHEVRYGSLFVCLKGTKQDGHDYISDAAENGASAIVAMPGYEIPKGIPYITVKDTRKTLAHLWYNYCGRPSHNGKLKLIAVTGTNGKTTTAVLLTRILSESGHRAETIGTLNGQLTTPDPKELYRILSEHEKNGIEYVVMEASSHALALGKLDPLHFKAGIFTNLTPEHLDFHHTMDEYFAAKALLFNKCDMALLNADDEYGIRIAERSQAKKLYYSISETSSDYHAENITHHGTDGEKYTLVWKNGRVRISTPMPGIFALYNTLAASSCALELGTAPRDITSAVQSMHGVDGRLEKVKLDNVNFTVYIDFAHTPDALEKTLTILRGLRDTNGKGRITVLFGCGGDRDPSKRPAMGAIASRLADFTIITSDNSRSEEPGEIIRQIVKGIDRERPYKVIESRREAIEYAVMTAGDNDIILLAGKGHERYEIDKNGRHDFDERECVRAAVSKLSNNRQDK